jgi:hypothetical protein
MDFLNSIFGNRKNKNLDNLFGERSKEDYFLNAAIEAREAELAVKEKRYDDAWRHYHQKKMCYMQQANRVGDAKYAIELDASVHEHLANILRLEGKHREALPHIIYWVLGGRRIPLKKHNTKFKSYFSKCDFKNTPLTEAEKKLKDKQLKADLLIAQNLVSSWINKA